MPKEPEANIEEQVGKELEAVKIPAPSEEAEPEAQPADDPEIQLEGGQKIKLSELKKGYMMQSDYTTKTQELSEQRKEVEELRQLADFLKANPKKLERIIAILDEKEEAIAEKAAEIKDELAELPEDDPYVKQLKTMMKTLKDLQKEIGAIKQDRDASQQEVLISQAQQVLSKTLDEVAKGYQFEDDEEKGLWRTMVLSFLKDNPKDYQDEADFTNTIKGIGKKYFDAFTKLTEKKVAKYVKSKGGQVPTTPTTPGSPMKKKPSMENLDEVIAEELEKAEKETSE